MSNTVAAAMILFLGNSITLHGPSAEVGWPNNWGMAASAKEKDYAHVFLDAFAEMTGSKPDALIRNIAEFERKYDKYDQAAMLKEPLAFKAGVVILAIGENVPDLSSESSRQLFQTNLAKLLAALKDNGNPTILVRSCFWPDKVKDDILRAACMKVDGIFVDISALGKDESNYARSEMAFANAGVAAHPGDKGMKAIAEALINALKAKHFKANNVRPKS